MKIINLTPLPQRKLNSLRGRTKLSFLKYMFLLFLVIGQKLQSQDNISLTSGKDKLIQKCEATTSEFQYEALEIPDVGLKYNGVTYTPPGGNNVDILFVLKDKGGKILWATQIGGAGNEVFNNATINCIGNSSFIVGDFIGSTTIGTTSLTPSGLVDGFVVKLDNSNGSIQWVKSFGSQSVDLFDKIKTDNSGSVIIGGVVGATSRNSGDYIISGTSSINFTPTPPSGFINDKDIFIISYDNSGNFRWQTAVGALDGFDVLESLEVAANGKFYLIGYFGCNSGKNTDKVYFGTDELEIPTTTATSSYISFFNSSGQINNYVSSTNCSAIGLNKGLGSYISYSDMDPDGKLILSSHIRTTTIDFPLTGGAVYNFSNASNNMYSFIGKLDNNCRFNWVKALYISTSASGNKFIVSTLKLDKHNNIISTGVVSAVPYYIGTFNVSTGSSGAFVAILRNDNTGTVLNSWTGSNACITGSYFGFPQSNLKYSESGYSVSSASIGTGCTQQFTGLSGLTSDYTYKFANIKLTDKSIATQCAGNNLYIDWDVPYTPGSNNDFIIELSDTKGDFDIPTVITTTKSLNFTWPIPSNIAESAKYRIRIKSTDPVFYSGPSDYFKISNPSTNGADFNYSSTCSTGVVQFIADTKLEGENIVQWEWDFGGGFLSPNTVPQASYQYTTSGPKTVRLRVKTSVGCERTSTKTIIIGSLRTPDFTYNKSCKGVATEFYSDYFDPQGTVTVYEWSWGDGTPNFVCSTGSCTPSSGSNPTHTFSPTTTPYNYNVTFSVTILGGVCSTSVTKQITIVELPPTPVISSTPPNSNTCWGNQISITSNIRTGYDFIWKENAVIVGENTPDHFLNIPYSSPNLIYSLTLNAGVGCQTTSSPLIFTIHPLFSEISSSSSILCNGGSVNLYPVVAYNAQTYYWEISTDQGVNWSYLGNTPTLSVSQAGYFRCLVSNSHCSNWSNVIIVTPWLNSSITATGGSFVTPGTALPLRVDNPTSSLTQIQWYLDGIPVLGPGNFSSYGAISPGNYYAISNGVCGLERTDEFPVYWSNVAPWDNTYLNGGTISSVVNLTSTNGYRVGQDLVVDAGGVLTITNSFLSMQPCAQIRVINGGILKIDGTMVGTENAQTWKRIYVNGNGSKVEIINNSRVWNAEFALIAKDNPLVTVSNSWFGSNGSHIADIDNTFSGNVNLSFNKFGHIFDPGLLYNCDPVSDISGFSPTRGTNLQFNGTGAVQLNANHWYQNKKFTSAPSVALVMRGGNAHYLITNTVLGFYDTGISILGNGNHQLLNNFITRPHELLNVLGNNNFRQNTGIYCADAKECTFNGNRLTNWANGIEYYRLATSTETQTIFENNKFLDNELGLVIADKMHPVCPAALPCSSCSTTNNINNTIKVKTACNLFDNNYVGMIGSGDIDDQGDYIAPNQYSAGNRFQGAASFGIVDLNIDWGVLWQDNNLNNKYYFSNKSNFDDPDKILGSSGQYCINGNTQIISDLDPWSNNVDPLNCSLIISRSKPNGPSLEDSFGLSGMFIFPNPANSQLTIETLNEDNIAFQVFDIHGRIVLLGEVVKGKKILDTNDLISGFYIFRFSNGQIVKVQISHD